MANIVIGASVIVSLIFLILGIVGIVLCVVGIIKTYNTHKNRDIIIHAIADYRFRMIDEHDWTSPDPIEYEVDYSDMEDYLETDCRWTDWGYTRILPPDKFEIIKPYIQDKKRKGK